MASTPETPTAYEPPTIERRAPVSLPLIGLESIPPPSAAFRPL
jgi:hypothetical protein